MTAAANPLRGECALAVAGVNYVLRPSFENLVLAEAELGSLFALVERAAGGALTLTEMTALLWHCLPAEGRPVGASRPTNPCPHRQHALGSRCSCTSAEYLSEDACTGFACNPECSSLRGTSRKSTTPNNLSAMCPNVKATSAETYLTQEVPLAVV